MSGQGEYSGMVDCMAKAVKTEGVGALWKGFFAAYARVGPRVVIAFVTMEQVRGRGERKGEGLFPGERRRCSAATGAGA
jgi:hypothetical protein